MRILDWIRHKNWERSVPLRGSSILRLNAGSSISTAVYCESDVWCRLDLLLTTYIKRLSKRDEFLKLVSKIDGSLVMCIYEEHSPVALRNCILPLSDIENNKLHAFSFDPIYGCQGKIFVISITVEYTPKTTGILGVCCSKNVEQMAGYVIYDGRRLKAKPVCLLFFADIEKEQNNNVQVSTIIVNYNGLNYLENCLKSITEQTYQNHEVILVDNNSSDSSVEFVKDNYPEIKLVALAENLEFARANNLGLEKSGGKYIIVLNPDTFVPFDFVANMVKTMECHSRVGAVGCDINTRGSSIRYASVFINSNRLIAGNRTAIKDLVYCLAPCGAAAMYRRSVLEDMTEFFDSDFITNWEDHDVGYRINLYGYWCLHNPHIVVDHIGGAAYGMTISRGIKIYKNMLLTYYKNMEWRNFIAAFLSTILRPKHIGLPLGVILFLKEITLNHNIRKKRKLLQSSRKRSDAYIRVLTSGYCRWSSSDDL